MPRKTDKAKAFAYADGTGIALELRQINDKLNRTEAQNRVLVVKIGTLEKAIETQNRAYDKLLTILSELWQRPDQLTPSEHIIKDFLRDKYKV